jgi:chlorophyll synthase
VGYLVMVDRSSYALAVTALVMAQLFLMQYFLRQPTERALFYSGFGVPLFVSGMMVAAFGIRNLGGT